MTLSTNALILATNQSEMNDRVILVKVKWPGRSPHHRKGLIDEIDIGKGSGEGCREGARTDQWRLGGGGAKEKPTRRVITTTPDVWCGTKIVPVMESCQNKLAGN